MTAAAPAPPPPPTARPPVLSDVDPRLILREAARLLSNGTPPELLLSPMNESARAGLSRVLAPPAPDPLLRATPPHDLMAERAVLGALLIDPSAVDDVGPLLQPDQLYKPAHTLVYTTVLDLRRRGQPVDVLVLNAELERKGVLEQVGGTAALAELTESVPTSANAEYYARIVRGHAVRRELIRVAAAVQRDAFAATDPADELVARAEADFAKASGAAAPAIATARDAALELWNEFKHAEAHGPPGLPTGYQALDEKIGGLQLGEVSAVGARTSMGKTTFTLALLAHLATLERAGIVSLEMPKRKLARSMAAARARVDSTRIRAGALTPDEMRDFVGAVDWLADDLNERLLIDDAAPGSPSALLSRVRRLAARGCKVIAVDYLQRVRVEDQRQQHSELADLSGSLKTIAAQHNVHVMIVVQLSRKVEDRRDHRPMLSDIGGSGQVENDIDLAMLLYRPSYYERELARDDPRQNLLEVYVEKNRQGEAGMVALSFDRKHSRIDNAPEGGFPVPARKSRFGRGKKDAVGESQD